MEPNIAIPKLGCSERKHDFEEKLSLQMNCHEVLVKITNQAALMYGIKGRNYRPFNTTLDSDKS